MDEQSNVYIMVDARGCITRCEGGYAAPEDLTGWIEIDAGTGDRYNLAQAHYFEGGLCTVDGLCRWKYADGAVMLRTETELAGERAALPELLPTAEEDRDALLVDHELRLTMLELEVS